MLRIAFFSFWRKNVKSMFLSEGDKINYPRTMILFLRKKYSPEGSCEPSTFGSEEKMRKIGQ